MTARILAAALILAWPWDPEPRVPWTEAPSCEGSVCAVEGTVARVEDDGAAIRLYFDAEERSVCVTLVRSWLVSWPDYEGRAIVATGPVRRFRGLVEIAVRDPSAIEVAGPAPSVEFEAPEKKEAEDLREEIRKLEDRVKELESR